MRNRLPAWFKQALPGGGALKRMRRLTRLDVHTVCREAKCPNFGYCFENKELTFMILGDTCTRGCRFCAVKKSSAPSLPLDLNEPYRLAAAVRELGLDYVVITSVTRDDLSDAGAGQFARTIALIQGINKNIRIEVLIPDFSGNPDGLKAVIEAGPSLLAHNLETVRRLYPVVRPQGDYEASLNILSRTKEFHPALLTKSSLMLGLGEKEEEVIEAMQDLRYHRCDILTLGQYLAPSAGHYPVREFISMEQFRRYEELALALGFKAVSSGPKVRSSYQAERLYTEAAYA